MPFPTKRSTNTSDFGDSAKFGGADINAAFDYISSALLSDSFSFIIYKVSSTYYSRNCITGDITSNSDAYTVIAAAVEVCRGLGSGCIFLKNGTYTITSPLYFISNLKIVGESRDKTILQNTNVTYPLFYHLAPISNFELRDITCTGITGLWYSKGVSNSIFKNVYFYFPTELPGFPTFFDGPARNPRNLIEGCTWEGLSNNWDMLGGGNWDGSRITNNAWLNGNGQGIGANSCMYTVISNNYFDTVGNAIGIEGFSDGNTITGNVVYNSGSIKVSGPLTTELSRWNIIANNVIMYGAGGIAAENSRGDIINGNVIARCRYGITVCGDRTIIQNNLMYDTNWANQGIVVGGVTHAAGGINLEDFPSLIAAPKGCIISGNKIITTRTNFTNPPDSATLQGWTGGINIGSTYTLCVVDATNDLDNTWEAITDHGTNYVGMKYPDGSNMILGTSTGTKIGTATTQKLGFFNKTPIQQPAANADTSGATLPNLEIEVNQVKQLLRDLGLMA